MKRIIILLLILSLTLSSVHNSVAEVTGTPNVGSWWFYSTGNETLQYFDLINSSDGDLVNVSVSEMFMHDNSTKLLMYDSAEIGLNIGYDIVKQSVEYNTTQKIRFSFSPFSTVENNSIQMNFTIDAITQSSTVNSISNRTNTYLLNFRAENYTLNNETIETYYFEGRIDYHYQKSYATEIRHEDNTTNISETFGNGTTISTIIHDNGTITVQRGFWAISELVYVIYGWFAPSVFRIVERNLIVESNNGLSLNMFSKDDAKKLISYNLVGVGINEPIDSETEETLSYSLLIFVSAMSVISIIRLRKNN